MPCYEHSPLHPLDVARSDSDESDEELSSDESDREFAPDEYDMALASDESGSHRSTYNQRGVVSKPQNNSCNTVTQAIQNPVDHDLSLDVPLLNIPALDCENLPGNPSSPNQPRKRSTRQESFPLNPIQSKRSWRSPTPWWQEPSTTNYTRYYWEGVQMLE